MLTRILADNFRALVNFELRPGRLSLLLGDNGSGKTSVFNVLGSLRDLIVQGLSSTEVFPTSRTQWESREVQRFELDFEESGGTYRYALEIQHQQGLYEKPVLHSESVHFEEDLLYRFSEGEVQLYFEDRSETSAFPYRRDQSFLTNVEPGRANRLGRLAAFTELIAGVWIMQPNPFATELLSRQETPFLMRNGQNLAAYFEYLNDEKPEVRSTLEGRLRESIPGFRNFFFRRVGDAKLLKAAFDHGEFNLSELSEGQRVQAMLYAAVYGHLRSGSMICFDEPDNFISLPEIQPWLQVLRDSLEDQGGQALIISHHPEVMDYLALDSIWRFERPSGPVIARLYEPTEAPELKLSELIARGA